MSKPITPAEAVDGSHIPDFVFDVINDYLRSGKRTILQNELVLRLLKVGGVVRHQVFEKGWLEFEGAYRKAGWSVEYDKPGHNESYEARWEFRRGEP